MGVVFDQMRFRDITRSLNQSSTLMSIFCSRTAKDHQWLLFDLICQNLIFGVSFYRFNFSYWNNRFERKLYFNNNCKFFPEMKRNAVNRSVITSEDKPDIISISFQLKCSTTKVKLSKKYSISLFIEFNFSYKFMR